MKYLLIAFLLIGCNTFKHNPAGPAPQFVYKQSGTIEGVTQSDYDRVFDVSFKKTTNYKITVKDKVLTIYEYKIEDNYVCFKWRAIIKDGLIYPEHPAMPAAPNGSYFKIEFDN